MLSKEAIEERKKGIGGSDAKKILTGSWYELWLDKTGRVDPNDILTPWDQAVRHVMEPIILDDYEQRNDCKLDHRGAALVHPDFSFVRCTLDGYHGVMGPVDAKALNIWTPDPIQWCIDQYTGQMQHQMAVTGAQKAALHVSLGMKRPDSIFFERDDFFLTDYLARCQEFWSYVERDEPPPDAPEVVQPTPPEQMRTVDMTGNNAWSNHAADWLASVGPAKTFKKAETELKALVEPDVREARGHGIEIKRNKAGSLSIKESK